MTLPDLQNAEIEFPIKRESHTLNIDFVMIPPPSGLITVTHPSPLVEPVSLDQSEYAGIYDEQQKRCRDIYAQLGVKVTPHRESVGAPSGAIKTAIESGLFDVAALLSEVKSTYGSLKENDHVMVVMVPAFFAGQYSLSAGLTPTREDGWCFVSLPWVKKVDTKKSTSAHEVGHTLGLSLDDAHRAGKLFTIDRKLHELMSESGGRGISGSPAGDGKRFVWEDVKDLQLEPNAKAAMYLLPTSP